MTAPTTEAPTAAPGKGERPARRTDTSSTVLEQRFRPFGGTDVQLVRADATDEPAKFFGHAAVFNSRTAIGNPLRWGWYEEIATGAFAKTLTEGDARFLVDHDSRLLVARVSAGDLRLAEDAVGLATDADLDTELSYVKDLVRNLEKKRLTGMSFGFYVVKDEWFTETVETSDGQSAEVEVRIIQEVRLLEVSAVTFPAYDDTDAGLRRMCDEVRSVRNPKTTPAPQTGEPEPADATRDTSATEPADATRMRLRLASTRMDGLARRP
jgi:HK97 family phage prohead protease